MSGFGASFGAQALERAALELTYEDSATLLRPVPQLKGSLTVTEPQVIYRQVGCALSRTSYRRSGQARQEHYASVIYMAPELAVRTGDVVEVDRLGQRYRFTVTGHPVRYSTYQAVRVEETVPANLLKE